MSATNVYLLAIGANLAFSTATIFFSYFSQKFSSLWINQAKVLISLLCFSLATIVSKVWVDIQLTSLIYLFCSGFIGLCLGDLLLFKAFSRLGPARTLVMFSFGPLFLGLYGFLFLNQSFTWSQTLAVLCMIICVFIFMLEKKDQSGKWEFDSFVFAFLGILLDNSGVILTREAYEFQQELHSFQVNMIRCLGAITGFIVIKPRGYLDFFKTSFALNLKEKALLVSSCVCGTFVSLSLYLAAVKYAHLGTLTAISITGPVWVSLVDCLYHRRLPNVYLVSAFTFFLVGFYFMVNQ